MAFSQVGKLVKFASKSLVGSENSIVIQISTVEQSISNGGNRRGRRSGVINPVRLVVL
jgi:hypothetical protein